MMLGVCRIIGLRTHSLVPVQLLLGKLVRLGMVEKSGLELGINRLELLEGSLLRHDGGRDV